MIKGEFFQNKLLAALEPHTRLLFIGLWTIADKEGRLEDNPDLIKAMLFPYETVPVDDLLTKLANFGFIDRYLAENVKCIQIVNFLKHQKIHNHEAASVLPCNDNVIKCSDIHFLGNDSQIGNSNSRSNSNSKKKEEEVLEIPYEEIISHLNRLTGKAYRVGGRTARLIKSRWRELYRLDDFLYVNQVKAEEWLGTDYEKYLRPETLYGNKFESYRQQRRVPRQYSEKTNQAIIAGMAYLQRSGVEIDKPRQIEVSSSIAETTSSVPERH